MRSALVSILAAIVGLAVVGCSGGDGEEKPLSGKPEIRETPPGTVPPGDTRPNPSGSDESRG